MARKQVTAKLITGQHPSPVLMSFEYFRHLNGSSLLFAFLTLTWRLYNAFSITLTTGTFDPSRLWWFATCSCKPIARGHTLISYAACCGTLISVHQTWLEWSMTMFFNRYGKIRCARLGLLVLGFGYKACIPIKRIKSRTLRRPIWCPWRCSISRIIRLPING